MIRALIISPMKYKLQYELLDDFVKMNQAMYMKWFAIYCVLLKCKVFKKHYIDGVLRFRICYKSQSLEVKRWGEFEQSHIMKYHHCQVSWGPISNVGNFFFFCETCKKWQMVSDFSDPWQGPWAHSQNVFCLFVHIKVRKVSVYE